MADKEQGGGPVPGAGQATVGDSRKLTQGEAGFREGQGVAGLQCGDCLFFEDSSCNIVEGRINQEDICDQFEPNTKDGHMTATQGTQYRSLFGAFDMFIYRATEDKQGVRRWYATTSGIDKDLYGERMSVELFDDFIARIVSEEEAPPPFISEYWKGGLPYFGIAHYLDLNGDGVVGPSEKVWRDGKILKAKGLFNNNPISEATFEAIQKDKLEKRADNERVRISIAFIDWAHNHGSRAFVRENLTDRCMLCEAGVGEKIYKAGHLVHFAGTRRPAYGDTEIVALEERTMGTSKRRDDAASIVGEELADEMEAKSKTLIGRSDGEQEVAPGAIVVKDESDGQEAEVTEVDHTLGGVQTLDDAEAFLTEKAAKGYSILLTPWDVLSLVVETIATDGPDDPEQKALAIREQLGQFQNTLDVQAAQAVIDVQRALGGKAMGKDTDDLVDRQVPPQFRKDEDEEDPKRRPAEEGEEDEEDEEGEDGKKKKVEKAAPLHPLDQFFATMREDYDNAVATPGDLGMKLEMIQEAFTKIGEGATNLITEAVDSAPADAATINRMVESAVEKQVSPIMNELAAMRADIQAGNTVAKSNDGFPSRRAIRMPTSDPSTVPLVKKAADTVPTDDNPTPKLRALARKSTIEHEQRRV